MTDLTKLSDDEVLASLTNGEWSPHWLRPEIERRLAARDARNSELEQELQEARERVEWLDNACKAYDSKIEAAEKERDEAIEGQRIIAHQRVEQNRVGMLAWNRAESAEAEREALKEALKFCLRADEIDRKMGYPLNGTSALALALTEAARVLDALSSPVAEEEET